MWKDHLPTNCPPSDANKTNGIVYRVIEKDTPDKYDFLSQRERGRDKPLNADECEFCGLSVFTNEEGVKQLKRRFNYFRNKKVCKGLLAQDSGLLKNTPSGTHQSHHTWWIPKSYDPIPLFHLVKVALE